MPVLHQRTDRSGYLLVTSQEGSEVAYSLEPEAERFLMMVLGMKPGDSCRVADLNLLVERGWAKAEARAEEAVKLRKEERVKQVQPVVTPDEPPAAPKPAKAKEPEKGVAAPPEKTARSAHSRRSRAREVALQVLYQLDQNSSLKPPEVRRFLERRLREPKLIAFSQALVDGVSQNQARLDEVIAGVAENWRLDRMATIDRNILRLGAYELVFCDEIPNKVAINEALELAKRYSTSQSSRFVNGLLDRLQGAGRVNEPETPAEEPDAVPLLELEPPGPTGDSVSF